MSPLFIYLLKASTTVFILWAFYYLCLRRMTFHRLNRYFFLGGILISMIWPLLPLTEWFSMTPQVRQVVVYIPISALMMQFKPETPTFGFEMAFKLFYFAGIIFMVVRLMIQIFSLRAIFKKSEVRMINGVKVRVVDEKINPFSFFGFIFLNPENHSPVELSAIILHEKIHETSTHSVDILLSEFFKILLWFNPFSWLFCRAVKENIEFEVDRVLLHRGIDCKEYQYSLLKLSSVKNQIVITNHFNLSNLKTRIIMMNKNQSSRYGLAAYALVIPLILLCMVFSYAFAQDKPIIDTVKHFTNLQLTNGQQKPEKTPDKALIILDGKVIDKAKMDDMNPDDIYSVNILKGKDATDIYGKKGKNGVVLITSKKPGTGKTVSFTYQVNDTTIKPMGKPLYIINGKESEAGIKDLEPNQIQSISVFKDSKSTAIYGDKGKNGVVSITLKGEQSTTPPYNYISTGTSGSGDGKGTTIVVTSKGTGEGKGEGSSSSTVNVTTSADGNKKVVDKDIVVTGYGSQKGIVVTGYGSQKGDSKYVIINTDSDTKDGKTVTHSTVNINPDDAFVIIDGVEGKISDVKADDIQSVEVKKGDAVKALWGEKAAKGIIIITTKKGGKSTTKDKK